MAPFAARFGIRPWEWDRLTVDDLFLLIDAVVRDSHAESEMQDMLRKAGG